MGNEADLIEAKRILLAAMWHMTPKQRRKAWLTIEKIDEKVNK